MTQLESARKGCITPEMAAVSRDEGIDQDTVLRRVADGTVVIPRNIGRDLESVRGVGLGLRTKVNANIGTSASYPELAQELPKLEAAVAAGAQALRTFAF